MFHTPAINIYTRDILKLIAFYERLGFQEKFRTPGEGTPKHVELSLDQFTLGIATVEAATGDHGLRPDLNGRSIEIVLWSDDTDHDYEHLTTIGAKSLSPPHNFLSDLRVAWVADPDGNPIQIVQHRKRKDK
jgi:catechol 2,3-dioxygenase-like lactoylglutathione lyase family enzyme